MKLDFPNQWVKLIMECVSSVTYKVRFNDSLSDIFTPNRGPRQGDPLSPYLFILCSKWLSRTITCNVANKNLEGVRMGRRAPEMTHLFFADDSMFFPNGFFSVKSAYNCLKLSRDEMVLNLRGENSDLTQITLFWRTIWRSKIQNKVKILIWRVFNNFLPVAVNLRK